MYRTIYPIKDATLYSQEPEQNTGVDQIIEIAKAAYGSPSLEGDSTVYYGATYNSRILIQFDFTDISASIVSGKINSTARFYLNLRATEATALPINYTLYSYAVSGSWTNGRGFYNNNPIITDGTSWKYRHSKLDGKVWSTSSYNPTSTGSFATIPGGGNWYTSSVCSQSFNHELPDIRMDVTDIVKRWLSGSIENNGFIVKLSDTLEQDTTIFGSIKFFSVESHTIFTPRLDIVWDNSDLTGTGSFSEIGSDDFVLYLKNNRGGYKQSEKPKVRIGVREKYPQQTYATSSVYLNSKRLPTGSYFQIQDTETDEIIIPFDNIGTKISCDTKGNYFIVDMSSLMPERCYKFVFKSEFDGGDVVRFVDDNYIFLVRR
jgi:hypothetical protein